VATRVGYDFEYYVLQYGLMTLLFCSTRERMIQDPIYVVCWLHTIWKRRAWCNFTLLVYYI